jgi:hypothetical protein
MRKLTKREKKVLRRLQNGWHMVGWKHFMLVRDDPNGKKGNTRVRTKTAMKLIALELIDLDDQHNYHISWDGSAAYLNSVEQKGAMA